MPTIFSHPAVPLAAAAVLGQRVIGWRLLFAGVLASILPDLDVLGFRLGIAYSHELGHRGFSHSLVFALVLGALAAAAAPGLHSRRWLAAAFVFVCCASHGFLDMCTTGGLGVAYYWPLSEQRHFLPFQVIRVSPLTAHRFLGPAGVTVLLSELRWIWLPASAIALVGWALRYPKHAMGGINSRQ